MNFRKAGQFGAQILITGSSLVSQLFKRLHPFSKNSILSAVGIRITGRRASRFRRATEIREKEKNRIADIDLAIRVAVASPEYEKRRIARRLIGPDLTNPLFMVDKRICCGGVTTHRMKAKRAFTSPRSRSVNSSSSGEIRVRSRVESSGSLPTKRAAAKHDESRDCGAGGGVPEEGGGDRRDVHRGVRRLWAQVGGKCGPP